MLTLNPMHSGHRGAFRTWWGRRDPYSLDELAEVIPFGWRVPTLKRTGIGRNVDLFRAAMRESGKPRNWGKDVTVLVVALNEVARGSARSCRSAGDRRQREPHPAQEYGQRADAAPVRVYPVLQGQAQRASCEAQRVTAQSATRRSSLAVELVASLCGVSWAEPTDSPRAQVSA